jgi:2-polyprenyl-3-methyl-5-hydroxy-6-metoxy-1,4-benzoquinol methylase
MAILEVACGKGGITLPIASIGCKVTAFDINKNSLDSLQRVIQENDIQNLRLLQADGYSYEDGMTYDIVIASEILEHVKKPKSFLQNITKRLSAGSYLIVTIPNGFGPWEISKRINPFRRLKRWNFLRSLAGKSRLISTGSGGEHVQFFTRDNLIELVTNESLVLIESSNSDSLLTIVAALRNSKTFGSIDIKLADLLPPWLASGWYFAFEKME